MADRKTGLLILVILLALFIPAQEPSGYYLKWFKDAEELYSRDNSTEETDSLALSKFLKVIAVLEKGEINDSLLWEARYKSAILHQSFNNFNLAIPLLRNCVENIDTTIHKKGSDLFLPSVYLGNSYYTINRFDSARFYYNKAEIIAEKYSIQDGLERLYNAFGVMNFETGNYRQSKNNFEKAISILESQKDPQPAFLVNYKGNLASALRKLYDFDGAMSIYRSLLPFNLNTDQLNHNIASVYLSIGASPQAIQYLHRTQENTVAKWNDLGNAHLNQEQYDSAAYYLNRAISQNKTEDRKDIIAALTHRYLGDLYSAQKEWDAALKEYQRTICMINTNFSDSNIAKNPDNYSGVFGVIELYESLLSKAAVFQKLFEKTEDPTYLDHALNTFRSLYKLVDYVEKTYDSDESRIFLNQKKYQSHHIPIDICLALYEKKKDRKYLEEAFYFDERNKASLLSSVLSESDLKLNSGLPADLLAEENNCKENINRLSLQASSSKEPDLLQRIQTQIREQELKLESINKKLNEYPAYKRLKFVDQTVTIQELQNKIIPNDGAILSYHLGDKNILVWLITNTQFDYKQIPFNDSLITQINKLNNLLKEPEGVSNSQITELSGPLYQKLIGDWEAKLIPFRQLMIIPDDELNLLPFEILMDKNGEYLIANHSITYNNSCTLLQLPTYATGTEKLLGVAPFSKPNTGSTFSSLPGSILELEGLKGTILIDSAATKKVFIDEAGKYQVLHLATHAQTNDEDPLKSFIAFYPNDKAQNENDRMYLPDIYSLTLKNTRLAILSACETGGGKLVRGEGIMSLSRAFSYAGCQNMIMSQWKANDGSTSYILKSMHQHLTAGNSIANSLQEAKIDYLNDASIEGRFKTPGYWAHLRYTGQFEIEKSWNKNWLLLLLMPLILILYFRYKQKKSGS